MALTGSALPIGSCLLSIEDVMDDVSLVQLDDILAQASPSGAFSKQIPGPLLFVILQPLKFKFHKPDATRELHLR